MGLEVVGLGVGAGSLGTWPTSGDTIILHSGVL